MDPSRIYTHQLDNGFVFVAEHMEAVSSASFTFLLPAGAKHDPADGLGSAAVLLDWLFRGAGNLDSRQLDSLLDGLGLHRESSVAAEYTVLGGALLGDNLHQALDAYADIIRRPHLPAEQFDLSRQLVLQQLASQDDDPRSKLMVELRKRHFPEPLGRNPLGVPDQLSSLRSSTVADLHQESYLPDRAILAVAGSFDWPKLREKVSSLFAGWSGQPSPEPDLGAAGPKTDHIDQQTAQTQIGIAYDSVPPTHPGYYQACLAVAVLSGGMSGRLFTEVREKRGLCYHVAARHRVLKGRGTVLCYAGTAAERAQQTLEVTLAELKRLPEGITQAELGRAKIGLKASLIMQGESTTARSASAAADYYHLARVRSLDEISDAIDAVRVADLLDHLQQFPPTDFTILSLGSKKLEVPC
ncbi:MAG: insulinase family protein [Phycisphaerae bacterium]|nr:insulinase family protein [Phycisphaerae bacterium]